MPPEGLADMHVLSAEMNEKVHRHRRAVGVKGCFMEGARRVAECEVVKLIDLTWETIPSLPPWR